MWLVTSDGGKEKERLDRVYTGERGSGQTLSDISSALGVEFLGLAISQSDRKMSLSLRKVPVPVEAVRNEETQIIHSLFLNGSV